MNEQQPYVKVRDLKQHFQVRKKLFEKKSFVKAVDGVSFDIYQGETLGIAGESGCGKSTLIRTIIRILEPTDGQVVFQEQDISHLSRKAIKPLRKNMQIVFQDPYSSLDPLYKAGKIISEPLKINGIRMEREERRELVYSLMRKVGLDESYIDRYPHEFSGGQRQRIAIARALVTNPKLVMLDEAVSALDVSVRAQILNLLDELQKEYGLTYVFVSHDLSVIEHICDRVIIMYLGKIVEIGSKEDIFHNAKHPYTRALLSSVPLVYDDGIKRERIRLEEEIPSPRHPPQGCRFHTRCPFATDRCRKEEPLEVIFSEGHRAYCHYCGENDSELTGKMVPEHKSI